MMGEMRLKKSFVLIGHPVGHSVSPAIHHAAYEQLGTDAAYTVVDCPDEAAVRAQVDALRCGELSGANVTVPWKQLAFELADEIHTTAARVGVANVLARTSSGQVVAYNTDASALAQELVDSVRDAQVSTNDRSCALVLGSGGAARAAVVACQLAKIPEVFVCARRFDGARPISTWSEAQPFLALGAQVVAWPDTPYTDLPKVLEKTHLIVQATSAGMKGTQGGSAFVDMFPWQSFESGVVYDLVYNPPLTPILKHAASLGHHAYGGLGMLVGQARDAIEIWLGQVPRREPLLDAARRALGL